jgi:hypothetical protein
MPYEIRRRRYSEKDLLDEFRRIASETGKDTVSQEDIERHSSVDRHVFSRRFGSLAEANRRAGLRGRFHKNVPETELLDDLRGLWDRLGRQPTRSDVDRDATYSYALYRRRFGGLQGAFEAMARRAASGEAVAEAVAEAGPAQLLGRQRVRLPSSRTVSLPSASPRRRERGVYGEVLNFRGLRHAPINESGVVYLFGIVSEELGFLVEAIRLAYPDCEAKRRIPGQAERWESVKIEFEYKTSNFRRQGHDPRACDVIVCWEHDWPECPIEVICLKDEVGKLMSPR